MIEESSPLTIRPLTGHDELKACVALQRETWGAGFDQEVPTAILWAAGRTGGIASGAFDAGGTLQGFVFGISGVEDGRLIHWSDMLAVRPPWRGRGLGLALKRHQRRRLLERGIRRAYWTFDPLEARNAHLNFRRLGVTSREYLRDVYGSTGSPLHSDIGTDRLIVAWDLDSERVARRLEGAAPAVPRAGTAADTRIAVPEDIQRIKKDDPEEARRWRSVTRKAFEHYLARGYVVTDAVRAPGRLYYQLSASPDAAIAT